MRSSVATSLRSSSLAANPQAKSRWANSSSAGPRHRARASSQRGAGGFEVSRQQQAPALVGQRLEAAGVERLAPTASL